MCVFNNSIQIRVPKTDEIIITDITLKKNVFTRNAFQK